MSHPVYFDCASTTPIDPRVRDRVLEYLDIEYGNPGSRTHEFGLKARKEVEAARDRIAAAVSAGRGEVVFTSGATESNNLAILGLAEQGRSTGKRHLVSTAIEHHAVLEPLRHLRDNGFELTLVAPGKGGFVEPDAVREAIRSDTLLVTVMHANNETGVIQPVDQIASLLTGFDAYFHVDAAQSFGREISGLRNPRVDLISVSGHKIHGPKGVGALIARRRQGKRPPLSPLMYGGGQELGLRPGTLPAHLIAGFGLAVELALAESSQRIAACAAMRVRLVEALRGFSPVYHGDADRSMPHILNFSLPGLQADEVIDALQPFVAISTGSACTSQAVTCSHVLGAMGYDADDVAGATRWSWCHLTAEPDWAGMTGALRKLTAQSTVAGKALHRGTAG